MKRNLLGKLSILMICTVLGFVAFANADAVVDWNLFATQAVATAVGIQHQAGIHHGAFLAGRQLARARGSELLHRAACCTDP